ncbi:MAG: 6-phosphogluconolactonase [Actinomycetota bacterium]|nr:6-phosphogluconolactonase [Actinomycetota bacterium]
MRIEIADSAEELAATAADVLAGLLSGGQKTFGLAGGSTPRAAYRELQTRDVSWDQVTCWLPDERWVPPADPDANALMARRELLDHVPAQFLAPDTTLEDPRIAASAYELLLAAELDPIPDVVLLGMGGDGHTASLFPGTGALDIDRSGYVANWVPALDTWRLTATVPLLRSARHIVFLVAGASKSPVLRKILVDGEPFPAALVAEGATDVTWLLDGEAAGKL